MVTEYINPVQSNTATDSKPFQLDLLSLTHVHIYIQLCLSLAACSYKLVFNVCLSYRLT